MTYSYSSDFDPLSMQVGYRCPRNGPNALYVLNVWPGNKHFQQCKSHFIVSESKNLLSEEILWQTGLHSTLIVLVQVMMKTDEIKFYEIMKAGKCKYQKHTDATQLYTFGFPLSIINSAKLL